MRRGLGILVFDLEKEKLVKSFSSYDEYSGYMLIRGDER